MAEYRGAGTAKSPIPTVVVDDVHIVYRVTAPVAPRPARSPASSGS